MSWHSCTSLGNYDISGHYNSEPIRFGEFDFRCVNAVLEIRFPFWPMIMLILQVTAPGAHSFRHCKIASYIWTILVRGPVKTAIRGAYEHNWSRFLGLFYAFRTIFRGIFDQFPMSEIIRTSLPPITTPTVADVSGNIWLILNYASKVVLQIWTSSNCKTVISNFNVRQVLYEWLSDLIQ